MEVQSRWHRVIQGAADTLGYVAMVRIRSLVSVLQSGWPQVYRTGDVMPAAARAASTRCVNTLCACWYSSYTHPHAAVYHVSATYSRGGSPVPLCTDHIESVVLFHQGRHLCREILVRAILLGCQERRPAQRVGPHA